MAAGKIFAVSFALNAVLSSGFTKAVSQGASKLQQLQSKAQSLTAQENNLNKAWRASQNAAQAYQSKMGGLVEAYTSGKMSQQQYNIAIEKAGQAMAHSTMGAQQYKEALASIQKEASQTSRHIQAIQAVDKAGENFTGAVADFKSTLGTAGLIAAPVMAAVKSFTEFDATLSKVKAIANATDEDMAKLKEQATALGRDTMFSATQAAEAMTYLGMAGWNTQQIMSGMPGLLDLAAASGSNLATVADIVSDDLTAFGMSAEQAGHMADVMAVASSNSNTNVEMMGMTFKYAGAVAGALGYSLEDVAVATGLMANAGIKAEQAGTSLRAMMNRMVAPPKSAAEAMAKLGISVTNADGSMKPFMQTMEDLRGAFAALSDSEKAEMASDIAGTEAMSGFLAVVNASESDFEKLCNAVGNADGAAQKMATTMQDNLQGDLTSLNSSIETVANSFGEVLTPGLRTITQMATETARAIADIIKNNTGLVASLAGLAAGGMGGLLAFKGFKVVSAGLGKARAEMNLMLIATEGLRGGFTRLISTARGLTWGGVIGKMGIALSGLRAGLASTVVSIRGLSISGAMSGAINAMQGLGVAIRGVGGAMLGIARAGIATMFSPIGIAIMALAAAAYYCYTNWATVGPMLAGLWETIQMAFTNAWTMLQPAMQGLFDTFGTLSGVVGENSGIFATLAQILGGAVVGAFITVATVAVGSLATAIEVIATLVSGAITTFTGLIQFITGVFTGDWDAAWQGVLNIFDGVFGTIGRIADRVLGGIQRTINSISTSISSLSIGGGGSEIAHNAQGGIYNKGAFLTTFAEEGPEAAIPLDGSKRAVSLWQKAGEILGMFPENTPVGGFTQALARQEMAPYMIPMETQQTPGYMDTVNLMTKTQPVAVTNDHNSHVDASRTVNNSHIDSSHTVNNSRVDNSRTVDNSRVDASRTVDNSRVDASRTVNNSHVDSSQTVSNSRVDASRTVNNNQRYESNSSTTKLIERFAPPPITINITVNGEAQVERIKEAVADAGQQMQRSFAEQMEEFMHNRGRLSFG